ncbi:MAG: aldose epimerase family protein [Bryobacteraceae bacterium]
MHIHRTTVAAFALVLASCSSSPPPETKEAKKAGDSDEEAVVAKGIKKRRYGRAPNGYQIDLYTLSNERGFEAAIMNYGGIVVSLKAGDKGGKYEDVVLGFDGLDGYLKEHPYFGALIGRYGNRIAKASFALNGVQYRLATNDGENHLHGGLRGFDKQVWSAEPITTGEPALELRYLSRDGEEGYPGNLNVRVVYTVTADDTLRIEYFANTDRPTVLNLTNHSYFNLLGQGNGDVLGHDIEIRADRFTPVNAGLIPTGELKPVAGTPFDFTHSTAIGARINDGDEQLRFGRGYDHNFVLNRSDAGLSLAARVHEPKSGRVMEVHTTEPGIQFYTGNFLDGSITGKGDRPYAQRYAFCLETQHFPDSPNRPEFPSVVLDPGKDFRTSTEYRFSAR